MSTDQSPRVLVIEDETTQRILVKEYLEERGYVVRLADDGRRGLEMASAINPDVIILDLLLPSMDGYTLCTCLKQDPATAHIPVILITASREVDVIERGMAAGASDFVTKPVDWSYLGDRVAHVLQQAGDMRRLTEEKCVREQQLLALLENEELSVAQVEELKLAATASSKFVAGPLRRELEQEIATARSEADERLRAMETALNAEREARRSDAERAAQNMETATRSFWSVLARTSQSSVPMLTALDQLTTGCSAPDTVEAGRPKGAEAPQTAVQSLLTATQNMVLLSQFMSGHAPLAETQFDIATLVTELVDGLRPDAQRMQIDLCIVGPDRPVQMIADPVRLRFALANLVDNALKYSPSGSTVRVSLESEPGQPVQITVEDSGDGIAQPMLQSLRQSAVFPDKTWQPERKRFGFGVPMAMAIAMSHGGDLALDSEVGNGTTAILQLPQVRVCDHNTNVCAENAPSPGTPMDRRIADVPIARLNALLAS